MTKLVSARMLERVSALAPSSRRAAAGRAGGDRRAGAAGAGLVFQEHRAYTPGDDLRYIDWNAYSRLRSLQVKLFEREESLDLHVLLDCSASMAVTDRRKLIAGARVAALVGAAALAHGDVVRFQPIPSNEPQGGDTRSERRVRAFAGRDATGQLLAALEAAVVPRERVTPVTLASALRESFPELRSRGAALLITDFLAGGGSAPQGSEASGAGDAWRRAIDFLLHRRVELTCVHVVAHEERHPSVDGPLRLADAESGEEMEIDVDDRALAEYSQRFERHLREVAAYLRGRGARHLLLVTGDDGRANSEQDILRQLLRAGVLR